MAGTFPTLSSGAVCQYGITRSIASPVRILRAVDFSEQRYRTAQLLSGWQLVYRRLKLADVELLADFFDAQKGCFDTSWVFPFQGENYTAMTFDQDEFSATESALGQYDVSLKIRQTKTNHTYTASSPATYPEIAGGIITQLPYTAGRRYSTLRTDMQSGLRYTWSERDYPQLFWSCQYPVITSAEGDTLQYFFTSMKGCYRSFTFTDPNTAAAFTCRLAMQTFDRQFLSYDQNAVSMLVEQVAA